MEKYGTDVNSLPPTDEQIKQIFELVKTAIDKGITYPRKLPITRLEAERRIAELRRQCDKIDD